jgi:hypothetical protein
MARNPLAVLLRLRRQAVDSAQAELAMQRTEAAQASDAVRRAEGVIVEEREAAMALAADDRLVEAYIAWLPKGQAEVVRARGVLARTESAVVLAEATLSAARAGAEAVEKIIALQADAERSALEARAQAMLDEAGSRARSRLEP